MYHNTANLVFPNQKSDTLVLTDSGLCSRQAVVTNHNTYEIQLINIYKLVFKSLPNRMSRYQNRPLVFQHYDMHRIVPTGPCVPVIGLPMSRPLWPLRPSSLPGCQAPWINSGSLKRLNSSNPVLTKQTNNTHQPQLILVPGKASSTPLSFHLLPTVFKTES